MATRTILNFGDFWNRDDVNFGWQNSKGHLKGYRGSIKNKNVVDFREQIGIYILYTYDREVIYIGQSGGGNQKLLIRLRQHTKDNLRNRWTNFSWFGMCGVDSSTNELKLHESSVQSKKDSLDEIEAILLQLFEPRLNRQGPKWGGETIEYLQYIDDEGIEEE